MIVVMLMFSSSVDLPIGPEMTIWGGEDIAE